MRYLFTLLLLVASHAWASFPATSSAGTPTYYWNGESRDAKYTAFSSAWAAYKATRPTNNVCGNYSGQPYGGSCDTPAPTVNTATGYTDFSFTIYSYNKANGSYNGPETLTWYMEKQTALVCPANSALSGTSCTCDAGYNESGSSCVADPPPNCPAGTSAGGYNYTVPPGGRNPDYFQAYDSRCIVETGNSVCTVGPDGTRYCNAQTKYTGDYCPTTGCTGDGSGSGTPSPTPPRDTRAETSGPCQPGYYYGTVNGQAVCVPGQGTSSSNSSSSTTTGPAGTVEKSQTTVTSTGTSSNGTQTTQTTQTTLEQQWSAARQITNQSESSFPSSAIPTTAGQTKTTTVTNSDGSKTEYTLTKNGDGTVSGTARDQNTVQKTESTTCTGSSCTVTSTTTTNGSQTGSTTGTTTKDGLCKSDPSNAQCGDGDGSFAGSCSAGFQCEGDAVQCAMAKKQHETACSLLENKSAESQLYDSEKGKTGNVTENNPNNSTQNIGSGLFDYSSATGGGSCIPDKSVTVMGQTLTLPFSNVCTWLDALGNILVSVSSLIALRIVMRG